jgi:hypothetical protein
MIREICKQNLNYNSMPVGQGFGGVSEGTDTAPHLGEMVNLFNLETTMGIIPALPLNVAPDI